MRVVVANNQAPFVRGGAELHASNLCQALRRSGHEAELVTIPFNWRSAESLVDHAIAASCIDLSEFFGAPIDLMVGLKFPAYLMHHPNKVVWLLHQHREAYDLWEKGGLRRQQGGQAARKVIGDIDTKALSSVNHLFANSRNVAARLKRFNGIQAKPLYHPPPLADAIRPGNYGDYFYFPSRISGLKRQELVLQAMAKCTTPAKVVFSGMPDSKADADALQARINEFGLQERASWLGHVTEEQMLELYAGARAVIFTPLDEDLGYITLEAMLAAKAVITTTDSGGPLEFIEDGVQGLVRKPDPRLLAEALDHLWREPHEASRLGRAGKQRYAELDISWDKVVHSLTGLGTA
jgi:glycosyltransferase involved in cell wall biosynthesis